uniref:Uncharacterized protein n=1 Tax=Rhizophora mucronata TaxID=61149 RepID=A0A2P2NYY1_RHIMU
MLLPVETFTLPLSNLTRFVPSDALLVPVVETVLTLPTAFGGFFENEVKSSFGAAACFVAFLVPCITTFGFLGAALASNFFREEAATLPPD